MPVEKTELKDADGLPFFTKDLIAQLVEAFPPRCIQPGEDPIAAHRYAAQVELVEQLAAMQEEVDADPRALRG